MLLDEQLLAHAPQWLGSVPRSTSQPLATLPSQLAKPVLQVIWQAELAHDGVPFCDEQVVVQAPQCTGSLVRLISQPLPTLPSQLAKPAVHVIWQAEFTQLGVPFTVEQAVAQVPQC